MLVGDTAGFVSPVSGEGIHAGIVSGKAAAEAAIEALEKDDNIKYTWKSDVIYIQHDFNNKRSDYYKYFLEPDKIIHLSWEGLPNYMELFHFEKNLYSSYYFIKDMVISGVKDVTIIGTCFEYGMQSGTLSEDMPSSPINSYALAKDTLRKFLEELKKIYSFYLKWIRLFYLYGEGQNNNSILEQLKEALNNGDRVFNMSGGEQLRDYLTVEDVADYIVKIALQTKIDGIINCCSGNPISIRRLISSVLVAKSVQSKPAEISPPT